MRAAKENLQLSEVDICKIKAIYFHAVAESITNNTEDRATNFKEPSDSLANRIAREYVAAFLKKHNMDNALKSLSHESNGKMDPEATARWAARKLKYNPDKDIFPQLKETMQLRTRTVTQQSESSQYKSVEKQTESKRKHTKSSKASAANNEGSDYINSQDASLTGFLVTEQPESSKKSRKTPPSREEITMTALATHESRDRHGGIREKKQKASIALVSDKYKVTAPTLTSIVDTHTRTITQQDEPSTKSKKSTKTADKEKLPPPLPSDDHIHFETLIDVGPMTRMLVEIRQRMDERQITSERANKYASVDFDAFTASHADTTLESITDENNNYKPRLAPRVVPKPPRELEQKSSVSSRQPREKSSHSSRASAKSRSSTKHSHTHTHTHTNTGTHTGTHTHTRTHTETENDTNSTVESLHSHSRTRTRTEDSHHSRSSRSSHAKPSGASRKDSRASAANKEPASANKNTTTATIKDDSTITSTGELSSQPMKLLNADNMSSDMLRAQNELAPTKEVFQLPQQQEDKEDKEHDATSIEQPYSVQAEEEVKPEEKSEIEPPPAQPPVPFETPRPEQEDSKKESSDYDYTMEEEEVEEEEESSSD